MSTSSKHSIFSARVTLKQNMNAAVKGKFALRACREDRPGFVSESTTLCACLFVSECVFVRQDSYSSMCPCQGQGEPLLLCVCLCVFV